MNPYKKFLRNFALISAGISIFIISFCIIADPYEIWNIYPRQGLNLYSFRGVHIERLTKPMNFILRHTEDKAIIIGSSRSDFCFSPVTWENLTGNTTYNFSVASSAIHEELKYFEYALEHNQNIKEVILCVDFFSFVDNPERQILKSLPPFDENKFGKFLSTLQDLQKILFSWESVKDSVINIQKNYTESPNYRCHDLNGKFSEGHILAHSSVEDSKFFGLIELWNNSYNFSTVELLEDSLKDFQRITELCRENNIKLYVCILPLYPSHYECFNPCWNIYDDWKIKLASIFPVYDFTCFDENLVDRKNFWDTSHTKLIIGDKILKSIHSGNLEFGEIITPENVQKHNEEITRQREIWRSKNLNK